jgi:DNA mismatch repair protein PMS2
LRDESQSSRDVPEESSDDGDRTSDEATLGAKETNEFGDVGLRPLSTTLVTGGRAVSPTRDSFDGKIADQSVQESGAPAINKAPKDKPSSGRNITGDTQTKHVESDIEKQKSQDEDNTPIATIPAAAIPILDFNKRVLEQEEAMLQPPTLPARQKDEQGQIPSTVPSTPSRCAGVVQSAFDRMRPKRVPADTATITIGSKTISSPIGTPAAKRQRTGDLRPSSSPIGVLKIVRRDPRSIRFSRGLRSFTALNNQPEQDETETGGSESSENERGNRSEEPLSDIDTQMDTDKRYFHKDENCSLPINDDPRQDEEDPPVVSDEDDSDEDYLDEKSKKAIEEDKVQRMIQIAEEAARPSQDNTKRAEKLLKNKRGKDATTQLARTVSTSVDRIDRQITALNSALEQFWENKPCSSGDDISNGLSQASAEERLSLTVSKEDFAHMRIVGQFNLGFIIATRPAKPPTTLPSEPLNEVEKTDDELFIIDQHASDEKYNFERLQAETIVQNQRLVKPRTLELTAVDEEIISEHQPALVKNGFLVDVDPDLPPGKRCKLVSLPMSRSVIFDHRDLEELIALLADAPTGTIPRPSKVRRMFAMRACRSSIMIGRTLTLKQMQMVLKHMGEIEKPWNCPHGRPTMRHLMGMGLWEGWEEGDGVVGVGNEGRGKIDWARYVGDRGEEEEDEGV